MVAQLGHVDSFIYYVFYISMYYMYMYIYILSKTKNWNNDDITVKLF